MSTTARSAASSRPKSTERSTTPSSGWSMRPSRRADATSSIARVSLRVLVIERTRRFRSWTDANYAAFSSLGAKRAFTLSISAFSFSATSSARSRTEA